MSADTPKALLTGNVGTEFTPGAFCPILLFVEGATLSVSVDGPTGSTSDGSYASRDAGVSTSGWYPVKFMNLEVTS